MSRLHLSKQSRAGILRRVTRHIPRLLCCLLPAYLLLPTVLRGQASVASDLWRVAAGTQVEPLALADGGSAPLWTPAVTLAAGVRWRVGVEAINSPSEIGVGGGLLALTARVPKIGLVSVAYGRLSVQDVALTETSPETIGDVPIYNQALSLGVSREVVPGVTGGIALRYLSGQLGSAARQQMGIDFGAQIQTSEHVRLGLATRFFDPTLRTASGAASYSLGAEYKTSAFDAWGSSAVFVMRYGLTAVRGESAQQLFTIGLALGTALALDGGFAVERASGDQEVRSRLAVTFGSGSFRAQIGRDGGVNDFGAAYRFGLTAAFR